MKKITIAILCLLSINLIACTHTNTPITQSELPQKAQSFINTYFPSYDIAIVIKDGFEYEVKFTNGFDIEFDKKGDWESIDCQMSPIPNGIVPEAIVSYVMNNYAQNFIVQISRDHHGYDVELNNDLDLDFDKNGRFIRIDN